jgi:hypothetical protein
MRAAFARHLRLALSVVTAVAAPPFISSAAAAAALNTTGVLMASCRLRAHTHVQRIREFVQVVMGADESAGIVAVSAQKLLDLCAGFERDQPATE